MVCYKKIRELKTLLNFKIEPFYRTISYLRYFPSEPFTINNRIIYSCGKMGVTPYLTVPINPYFRMRRD